MVIDDPPSLMEINHLNQQVFFGATGPAVGRVSHDGTAEISMSLADSIDSISDLCCMAPARQKFVAIGIMVYLMPQKNVTSITAISWIFPIRSYKP